MGHRFKADRVADEVTARALEWLREATREPPSASASKHSSWGPPGGTTNLAVTEAQSGDARWKITASGSANPHNAGRDRSPEEALAMVRDGILDVMGETRERLRWLRENGVDLRELVDELLVEEVMSS